MPAPFMAYLSALNDSDRAAALNNLRSLPHRGVAWNALITALPNSADDAEEVISVLARALHDPDERWPSKYNDIGLLAAVFGAPELALEALSVESRLTTIRMFTLWYPVLREVRQLAGFKQLMTELNLPTYWREYGWPDHCQPIGELDFECG